MYEHIKISGKWLWGAILVTVIAVVVICYWWFCWYGSTTTIFLVRHADKAGQTIDDLHDPLGVERSEKLMHVLGSADITGIYHSDTLRSQKTAEPLASHLGITPVSYPPLGIQQLVADIKANHTGERVFVVGHSNTVPDIIQELGATRPADIAESVYDNLYVVTLCPCTWWSSLTVINMKYGVPTNP